MVDRPIIDGARVWFGAGWSWILKFIKCMLVKLSVALSNTGENTIPFNLHESVRNWVLKNLPYDQLDTDLDNHLRGLDAHGLLVVFHNWTSRLIIPRARQVHISATLNAKIPTSKHKAVLENIIANIECGQDLNIYLSRGIKHVAAVPRNDAKFNKRRDLDLLLLDWELHHMHLSTIAETDGFVGRTDDLLFAVFRPDNAYLVEMMPHGSWVKEHLIKILMNELGEANVVHEIKGVVGLSYEPNEEDRKQLRNAGINTALVIDSKAVMTLGGMSTAGTSIHATRELDMLLEAVQRFEDTWENHRGKLDDIYQQSGIILPDNPEFNFEINNTSGPGIFESKTKSFYPLTM